MDSKKTKKIVITALMAAITMVATMSIKLPSPTGGYIHPGDAIVILSGVLLGPIYGSFAAGLGSMLADIFSGYTSFAIATFVIKALAALVSSLVYRGFCNKFLKFSKFIALIIGGIAAGLIVTPGYLLFEAYILELGLPAAIGGVPFNIVQNIFGVVLSVMIMPILSNVPTIKEI